MSAYVPLLVTRTEREIKSATSVVLEIPEAHKESFRWRPGQHLNIRFFLDSEELRRSYSISSSPMEGPLRITVKRVRGGRVSNHINDNVEVGDQISAMSPSGSFCLDPREELRRTHYFFGAGSGITPLFAMLSSVLIAEPHSFAYLLYGNRNAQNILFRATLEDLAARYPERLQVVHSLSRPGLWSSFDAWKGKVDRRAVERFIALNPPYAQDAQYYICGPGGMNTEVKKALMSIDVPEERIHRESYGGAVESDETVAGVAARASVELGGKTLQVEVPQGKTVLQALLDAGHTPPYSCQAGVCSTCQARLMGGSVHMRSRMALEDAEIERGAILACQSIPTSERIALSFDGSA